MSDDEQSLNGGNSNPEVVRIGDTVRRAAGPWTPAVHRLLDYLEERSFPAPRPLGIDEKGREILSFIPGVCIDPDAPDLIATEQGVRRAGQLVAGYHQAQQGFVAPSDACWRDEARDPTGSTEVLAHNDLAPWNLVAGRSGWAFIDWDLAAPARRLWDLAWAVHSFAGLWPDSPLDDEAVVRRIAAFCDGAEVEVDERSELLDVVVERTRGHAELLQSRAAEGDRHFIQLVAEGHAEAWSGAARYVEAKRTHWSSLLTP